MCRIKKSQSELLRFVVRDGVASFDKKQNMPGRGFYVCSEKCWNESLKKKKRAKISSRENKFIALPEKKFKEVVGD